MKSILSILAATTALTVAIGLPAQSGVDGSNPSEQVFAESSPGLPSDGPSLIRVSGDDDDEEDDDRDDDCEDDDEGDDEDCSAQRPQQTNGPIKPPANGLFGNGAPPTVQVN